MSLVSEVAAACCALLFLAAVVGKLDSWKQWRSLTEQIPVFPRAGRAARVGIPALEAVIVALSLAVPRIGLAAAAVTLLGLALAVWVLSRHLDGQECNCFGAIAPARISPRLWKRNLALAALAGLGWYVSIVTGGASLSGPAIGLTFVCGAIALLSLEGVTLLRRAKFATNQQGESR